MQNYQFFQNKGCEFFPCHKNCESVNCIFCYCPIYLYEDCGGNFKILDNGIKDCSDCCIPHSKDGYDYIVNFIKKKNKDGIKNVKNK